MNEDDLKVVALLQDPRGKGGTATVVSWYRRWVEAHDLNVREWYLDDTTAGWPRRYSGATDKHSLALTRFLPKLHAPQYAAARHQLRHAWADVESTHVVGATCLQGALAPRTLPKIVWLATTIADERSSILPLVSTARRTLYRATLPLLRHIEHEVLANAARVLAMSSHTADLLTADGIDPRKIEVVPVPVDTERFSPANVERRGVLFVGRALDPRKGFSRVISLVTASSLVRDHGLQVVSPSRCARTWSDDVDGAIHWCGRVDTLHEYYRRAELLVITSYQEGLGIVALEALACGTPVVAYRCGGLDNFLHDSGGGIVVADDHGFRTTVEALLTDEETRREMGQAGRAWVERHLSSTNFLANPGVFSL